MILATALTALLPDGSNADAAPPPIATWHVVAVIEISEKGNILSCVDETPGGPPAGLGDPCVSFKGETPPAVLEGLGGADVARRVTIEGAMAVGDTPRPALRYHRASQAPSGLASVTFEVSNDGKVENCRKIETGEERWTVKLPSLCSVVPGPYTNGKSRRVAATFTVAFSTAR